MHHRGRTRTRARAAPVSGPAPTDGAVQMDGSARISGAAFAGVPCAAGRAAAAAALCAALAGAPAHALRAPVAPAVLPAPQLDAEHALAAEAWGVVGRYFADGRGAGWARTEEDLLRAALPSRRATYRAVRGALAGLGDRYSRLLTPGEMDGLRKYDVSGVGLLLTSGPAGELVVAAAPLPGTPAAAAGVQRGDELLAIAGERVAGAGAFDAAQRLRGDDGAPLRLTFRDRGEVELTRRFARAGSPPVETFLAEPGPGPRVGTVVLPEFAATAPADVAAAVAQLREAGADAIALDLRGNPGGVFQGALEVAGVFEGGGVPVAVVTAGAETETFRSVAASDARTYTDVPLAVVVDERSASAAEVLAGGLRDQCRAAIVGPRASYGKGLIQGVFALSDGSGLVLTVAKYETPHGTPIQGTGLAPDFGLDESFVDKVLRRVGVSAPAKVDFAKVGEVVEMCKAQSAEGD